MTKRSPLITSVSQPGHLELLPKLTIQVSLRFSVLHFLKFYFRDEICLKVSVFKDKTKTLNTCLQSGQKVHVELQDILVAEVFCFRRCRRERAARPRGTERVRGGSAAAGAAGPGGSSVPLHVLTRVTVGASAPGPGAGAEHPVLKEETRSSWWESRISAALWVSGVEYTVWSREYVPLGQPLITAPALQGLEVLPDKKKKSCPAWRQ